MSNLKCPVCPEKELVQHDENGTAVDYCEGCGGIWLAKGELNKIVHPHEGDLEFCTQENSEDGVQTQLGCPVCENEKLVKDNFIEFSDIKLEYCNKCEGIWLEKGELDAINKEIDTLNDIPDTLGHKIMLFIYNLPFN